MPRTQAWPSFYPRISCLREESGPHKERPCRSREKVLPQFFLKESYGCLLRSLCPLPTGERGILKHAEVGCFFFFFSFLIGVYLLSNTVLISPVHQSEPAIMYTYTPSFFGFPFHVGHQRAPNTVPCVTQWVLIRTTVPTSLRLMSLRICPEGTAEALVKSASQSNSSSAHFSFLYSSTHAAPEIPFQ